MVSEWKLNKFDKIEKEYKIKLAKPKIRKRKSISKFIYIKESFYFYREKIELNKIHSSKKRM